MTTLVFASLGAAVLGASLGLGIGISSARRRLGQAEDRYQALQRDYQIISAVNVRLMNRSAPMQATSDDSLASERFFNLYDDAKRCLHRALDRHNATAPRPLVISRDGGNLLQVLAGLPEQCFSEDVGEDAGVRAWLRRVFELDLERRAKRDAWCADALLALERERDLWLEPLKKRA